MVNEQEVLRDSREPPGHLETRAARRPGPAPAPGPPVPHPPPWVRGHQGLWAASQWVSLLSLFCLTGCYILSDSVGRWGEAGRQGCGVQVPGGQGLPGPTPRRWA